MNDSFTPPGHPDVNFFSYNQPSINKNGQLVFRGRAKAPMGELLQGESSGGVLSGVWTTDLCFADGVLTTVADRTTLVPAPNSEGATFNEFPSIPRIDADHFFLGTRGNHAPVESFILPDMSETKAGSNGLYYFDGQLKTAMTVLGNS